MKLATVDKRNFFKQKLKRIKAKKSYPETSRANCHLVHKEDGFVSEVMDYNKKEDMSEDLPCGFN